MTMDDKQIELLNSKGLGFLVAEIEQQNTDSTRPARSRGGRRALRASAALRAPGRLRKDVHPCLVPTAQIS